MTPLEAAAMAAELLARMDRLSVLDLHPVTNAADLETMRAGAETVARDVLGYLLSSINFVPVTEAGDAVQEWQVCA
jgi:hypothetical protein